MSESGSQAKRWLDWGGVGGWILAIVYFGWWIPLVLMNCSNPTPKPFEPTDADLGFMGTWNCPGKTPIYLGIDDAGGRFVAESSDEEARKLGGWQPGDGFVILALTDKEPLKLWLMDGPSDENEIATVTYLGSRGRQTPLAELYWRLDVYDPSEDYEPPEY